MAAMIPIVTFLSDFGLKDAYVAQVKGVILSQVPEARIVDISHGIEPFDLISAGWLLATTYRHFPDGTVHLAVVDPGVGTDRAVLMVHRGGHIFVGPDNGLFSFLYPADDAVEVTWRPEEAVSSTFHGRDIFARLVVRVITGHGLGLPGKTKKDPVGFDVSSPMVVHVDAFGTVVTNIPCKSLNQGMILEVNGHVVDAAAPTFAAIPAEGLGLIPGSAGTVEIAGNRIRAVDSIGARPGMKVAVHSA